MTRYLVVDVETTGLDRNKCVPMELAFIALDQNLVVLGEYEGVIDVRNEPAEVFEDGAIALHKKTGLFLAIERGQGNTRETVENGACAMLAGLGFPRRENVTDLPPDTMMIGRSPDFDRAVIRRCTPMLDSFLHYRAIDVRTLVQIASIATGIMPDRLKSAIADQAGIHGQQHRALNDCRLALAQLIKLAKHYNGASLREELVKDGAIA